jgi:crossover junction endodeoxyribonuclease RuvC
MIIFGVDPGTIHTGFGIIHLDKGQIQYIASGIIKPPPIKEIAPRLKLIYDELNALIKFHKPDVFCIETAFYGKNVQSAMKIGYVRGIAMLVAAHNQIEIEEYSPREIKKAVVGNGAASKEQVQYMIRNLLSFKKAKIRFDESDALATAICHSFKLKSPRSRKGNWKSFVEDHPEKVIDQN